MFYRMICILILLFSDDSIVTCVSSILIGPQNEPDSVWRLEIGVDSPCPIASGTTMITGGTQLLGLADRRNLRVLWSTPYQPKGSNIMVTSRGVVVFIKDSMYGVNTTTGDVLWSFTRPSTEIQVPGINEEDGVVAVGTYENGPNMFFFDIQSGTKLYEFSTGRVNFAPPLFCNGTWFVGSSNGLLFALTRTAQLLWSVNPAISELNNPSFCAAGNIIIRGSYASNTVLVALNQLTGSTVWTLNLQANPLITYNNSALFIGLGNNITLLSAMNGDVIWTRDLGGPPSSAVLDDTGIVFVSSGTSTIRSLNASTGIEKWNYVISGATSLKCISMVPKSGSILALHGVGTGLGNFITMISKCAAGYASSEDGCNPCAAGTYSEFSVDSLRCLSCPIGTYNPFAAQAGEIVCQPCNPGTYADTVGSTRCTFCDPGYYGNSAGASSKDQCLPCSAGTYNPAVGQSQSGCVPCSLGTASNVSAATESSVCVKCLPGYYNDDIGSSTCKQCHPGTFVGYAGATSCQLCPRGTYSSHPGAISNATCEPCPIGTSTSFTGATSVDDCTRVPFSCATGFQLANRAATSCVPLICPKPLVFTANGCMGCSPQTFGTVGSCTACEDSQLCPGLLSRPLPRNVSVPNLCNPSFSVIANNDQAEKALVNANQSVIGIVIAGLVIIFVSPCFSFFSSGVVLLENIDAFALDHPLERNQSPANKPTSRGGICTIFGISTIVMIAAVLWVRRNADNILVQKSLAVLDEDAFALTNTASWATGNNGQTGIEVRIIAYGEVDACSQPLTWTGFGSRTGDWLMKSIEECGDGSSVIIFRCPTCIFSGSSYLAVTLPYSCQSLQLQAIAVDASGEIMILKLVNIQSQPPFALASISWEIAPLLAIQRDDYIGNGTITQGYQLLSMTSSPSYEEWSSIVRPAEATVNIKITLPLQNIYSYTTLSVKVSDLQLLSSIIGLSGIFSGFAIAYKLMQTILKVCNCERKRILNGPIKGGPSSETESTVSSSNTTTGKVNKLSYPPSTFQQYEGRTVINPLSRMSSLQLPSSHNIVPHGTVLVSSNLKPETSSSSSSSSLQIRERTVEKEVDYDSIHTDVFNPLSVDPFINSNATVMELALKNNTSDDGKVESVLVNEEVKSRIVPIPESLPLPPPPPPPPITTTVWIRVVDDDKDIYYYDPVTKSSVWELPEGAVVTDKNEE